MVSKSHVTTSIFLVLRDCPFSLRAAGPLFLACPFISLFDGEMMAQNADDVNSREHPAVDDEDRATLERVRVSELILDAASAIRQQALTLHQMAVY
jgi:hypothetical protein